jgi:hypothetical protein
VIGLEFSRGKDHIVLRVRSDKTGGFRFVFAPALGLGAKTLEASANGRPLDVAADERPSRQSLRPRLEFPLTGDDTIELRFVPGPEIVLPDAATTTGDASVGLRLVRSRLSGGDLVLSFEGRAGESYTIEVLNSERIETVSGAAFDGHALTVAFPDSSASYATGAVTLKLK